MIAETPRHYLNLLETHPYLAEAICWTVVQPVTMTLDLDTLVQRLGGRPQDLEHEFDHAIDEAAYEAVLYLGRIGSSFIVFEYNGFQGVRPEVLRRLSDGARVMSLYWNVNWHTRLSYAIYGTVVTTLNPMSPKMREGHSPTALDAELVLLEKAVALNDGYLWQPAAMSVVESCTGVRLDASWLSQTHPRLLLKKFVAEDPHPPSGLGGIDPDLDVRLRLAPASAQTAVLHSVVTALLVRTGLTDEPFIQQALDRLASGTSSMHDVRDLVPLLQHLQEALHRDPDSGELSPDNPETKRYWAAHSLKTALASPSETWPDRLDALVSAPTVLGDDWKGLRAQVRDILDGG
ncbi:DUF6461 domain-containing protein [Streptosporangium roseum]|uniref:DUF6461 domain-containing protein n=1 Tax=Streptosporangium roseum TaxID=2001 RepID=UPI00332F3686